MRAVTRGRAVMGEAGDTLIELLVTVVLMSVAVVAIIGGIAAAVELSGLHRSQADVSAALVSTSEYLKAQQYVPCCTTTGSAPCTTTGAVDTVTGDLSTFTSTYGQIEGDVPNPTVTQVTDLSGDSCDNLPTDPGIEMIWLQATSSSGKTSETQFVVKADNR